MEPGIVAYLGDTIYLAGPAKKLKTNVSDDSKVAAALQWLNKETAALQGAGFPDDQVKFNLVKDWMESGAYTNTNTRYNNPGNIKYSQHSSVAKKGAAAPGGGNWAVYTSLNDYARDLQWVLMLPPGRPFQATGYPNLADFAHRLKLNKYYGDESEASYLNKLQGAQQRLRIISNLQTDTHQDVVVDHGQDKFMEWWNNLTTTEKVLGGVGAFFAIFLISRR